MPQFDFANVTWPQLAWLALFFVVLYFGVVRMTLPKLGKVMEQREDKITGDLSAAQAAKETADQVDARYHAEMDASREQARQAITRPRLMQPKPAKRASPLRPVPPMLSSLRPKPGSPRPVPKRRRRCAMPQPKARKPLSPS